MTTLRTLAQQTGLGIEAALDIDFDSKLLRKTVVREFTGVFPANSLLFIRLRPKEDVYDFTDADTVLDFAEDNDLTTRGHTLVWHMVLPEWLTSQAWAKGELKDLLRDHITTVVGRYKGEISYWNVVNEPFQWDGPNLLSGSFWHKNIGPEYIDLAFRWANRADTKALLFLNGTNIYKTSTGKMDAVYNLVSGMLGRGVPIHGIGMQMHLHYWGHPWETIDEVVNLADLRKSMQRFANLGLVVHITEMDIRLQVPATPEHLEMQATIYKEVFQICIDEPNCHAFTTWGVGDADSWIPHAHPSWGVGLLFDEDYQPKPAYDALLGLVKKEVTMASVLSLPGTTGNDATVPDSPATSVTGDIDVRFDLAATVYAAPSTQYLVNKGTGGVGHSWFWWITTDGKLQSAWIIGAATKFSGVSTTDLTTIVGNRGRVQGRVTRIAASGLVSFYYKATGDASSHSDWIADGTSNPDSGNLDDTATKVSVGAIDNDNTNMFVGNFYRAIIIDGIAGAGTVVFDPVFTAEAPGTTSFTESSTQGATVTINQSGSPQAEIVADSALLLMQKAHNYHRSIV